MMNVEKNEHKRKEMNEGESSEDNEINDIPKAAFTIHIIFYIQMRIHAYKDVVILLLFFLLFVWNECGLLWHVLI